MIKGDVHKLIDWLNLNDIDNWQIATSRNKQDNSLVFARDMNQPREQEINRMVQIMSLSENTLLYVMGKQTGHTSATGNFCETWQNVCEETKQAITGVTPTVAGFDQNSIQKMVNDAVEKERLRWELDSLKQKQNDFENEKKEFARQQEGVIGTLVKTAYPYLRGIIGNSASVAVGSLPAEQVQEQNIPDAEDQEQGEQQDEQAQRLGQALLKYRQFDPDYIDVLCKLIDVATSGQPLTFMNGMVKLSYDQIKEQILSM